MYYNNLPKTKQKGFESVKKGVSGALEHSPFGSRRLGRQQLPKLTEVLLGLLGEGPLGAPGVAEARLLGAGVGDALVELLG
jgi:hypothetical protein